VLLGYGLAAATKIVFPLAVSLPWVVGARFIDRVGKGIRGAPRDALIADLTPDTVRGRAFGLRQALDTIGAVAGPLLAVGAMALFAGSFRAAFGVALIPAALCVALLVLGVREPPGTSAVSARKLSWRDAGRLGLAFYITTTIAVVMTLARFSEAFLVLRARDVGLDAEHAPWVMVTMSAVYAVLAFPAGRAADHGRVIALLVGGFAALAISDIVLALATGPSVVMAGAACWGVHMALTQGVLAALVAAAAPAELRGTAFGVFNLASGAALLVASALAGVLWQAIGPAATFLAGAAFTCVGLLGVLVFRRVLPRDAANTGTRTQSNRAA